MAWGKHWEWRAFADRIPSGIRQQFETWPLKYPNGPLYARDSDEYLSFRNPEINFKFREADREDERGLKLKRLLKSTEKRIELWLEDKSDFYPYAELNASVLERIATTLGARLEVVPPGPYEREATIAIFASAEPPPKIITVDKIRQTRKLLTDGAIVTVEIAEIRSPERVFSIGIETEPLKGDPSEEDLNRTRGSVASILMTLELPRAELAVMNYVEAIGVWAKRKTIREYLSHGRPLQESA